MAHCTASGSRLRVLWATGLTLAGLGCGAALAQSQVVTPAQQARAAQVAQAGVPLADLAPDAPDSYTVKRGDTLWAISGLFLKSPWRWPDLWGMNMAEVRNPHRIYPGQQLHLEKSDGRARLRVGQAVTPGGASAADGASGDPSSQLQTVRVSPRTRFESLADASIPTLQPHLIEPFLVEAQIVSAGEVENAPRLVGTSDARVLIARGDRAYARGRPGSALIVAEGRPPQDFGVFRNATPVKDPVTGAVLGYEAVYLGRARLVRSESVQPVGTAAGTEQMTVAATLDILSAREEMSAGDRLLPEVPRPITSYAPHAPAQRVDGNIVSVYGSAVNTIGQNNVVLINRGQADGMEAGHVLAIHRSGNVVLDRTQPGELSRVKLPDERSGLLMVFRTFERLSYALVLRTTDTIRLGDRVTNPG